MMKEVKGMSCNEICEKKTFWCRLWYRSCLFLTNFFFLVLILAFLIVIGWLLFNAEISDNGSKKSQGANVVLIDTLQNLFVFTGNSKNNDEPTDSFIAKFSKVGKTAFNNNPFIIFSLLTSLYILVSAYYYCLFRSKVRAKQIKLNLKYLTQDDFDICLDIGDKTGVDFKMKRCDTCNNEYLGAYGYDACRTDILRLALPVLFATAVTLLSSLFFFLG